MCVATCSKHNQQKIFLVNIHSEQPELQVNRVRYSNQNVREESDGNRSALHLLTLLADEVRVSRYSINKWLLYDRKMYATNGRTYKITKNIEPYASQIYPKKKHIRKSIIYYICQLYYLLLITLVAIMMYKEI